MAVEKIAVVGLGYVGLPLALALSRQFAGTVGFDINEQRLNALRTRIDPNGENTAKELESSPLHYTSKFEDMKTCTFFIVAVPTPVDVQKRPDLTHLQKASETVGRAMQKGALVVFESTVYPGVTEDYCGPILEKVSGLKRGKDFFLGYSPERINPGDSEHTLERVVKIVSGQDGPALERVATVYSSVVKAGVHRAPTIRVAEAAKVIENTQRDLNIALMNELALIFDRMNIRTRDVLAAAGTKWNFLPFRPGLVGGHCIGVDPYYLTAKAEELGYQPEIILSGRRINDGMGPFLAQKMIKLLSQKKRMNGQSRVGILGLTFKENVSDLRNSRVPDIDKELREYGISALIHDPLGAPEEARHEYGIELMPIEKLKNLDGLILAVPHRAFQELSPRATDGMLAEGGVLMDVKSQRDPKSVRPDITYWCL